MSENWYYVLKGQRMGPVDVATVMGLAQSGQLRPEDYVWRKGMENWSKLAEVEELQGPPTTIRAPKFDTAAALAPEPAQTEEVSLGSLAEGEKAVWVRIGADRGGVPTEYGPYSVELLKRLYKENRINGRTQFFIKGQMEEWAFLADLTDFEETFNDVPPVIQEVERRKHIRKPLLARMFVQNNRQVYEGVCRDISVGGMQVLTDGFPGKAGDRISINVHPDNSDYHFTAAGQVVRILDGNQGFSFRFEGLEKDSLRAIEKYIADVDTHV